MFWVILLILQANNNSNKNPTNPRRRIMSGTFEIYQDKGGEFRFRLKDSNGQNILASEGYKAKSGCTNGVESVKKNGSDEKRFERKETSAGKFMFNLRAGNNQIIGTSTSYASAADRDAGIESVKNDAANATVVDLTAQ